MFRVVGVDSARPWAYEVTRKVHLACRCFAALSGVNLGEDRWLLGVSKSQNGRRRDRLYMQYGRGTMMLCISPEEPDPRRVGGSSFSDEHRWQGSLCRGSLRALTTRQQYIIISPRSASRRCGSLPRSCVCLEHECGIKIAER